MKRRTLLIAGLIALASSLIGPTVQASITGETGWWRSHMSGYGHMAWWEGSETTDEPIEGAAGIEVTAAEFAFSPDQLTMVAGEPTDLIMVNVGDLHHDLVIPDLGVRLVVGPNERETLAISPEKVGTYELFCSYPGHEEAGMAGRLEVTPNT